MKEVIYKTDTNLECTCDCNSEAEVSICLLPALVLSGYNYIDATITECTKECRNGILFRNYTIQYDEALLTNPSYNLINADIKGVICKGCLTDYIQSVAVESVRDNSCFSCENSTICVYPEVYPECFGAVGDGVVDDTDAVQAAIDAVSNAGGGVVFFGRGTYAVTGVEISSPNVTLRGSGLRSTVIKKSNSATNSQAILISASYCQVRDLTIQGITPATFVTYEDGILAQGTSSAVQISNITIDNVEVSGVGRTGIETIYASSVLVNNCRVHDVAYCGIGFWAGKYCSAINNEVFDVTPGSASNVYGIVFSYWNVADTQSSYGYAIGNYIHDLDIWEGIDTHGWTHITVSNNNITHCKRGIVVGIDALTGFIPHNAIMSNNTIDAGDLVTAQEGIVHAGLIGGTHATGGVITGNTIKNHRGFSVDWGALTTYATKGCVISGNSLINSYGGAITLFGHNTDIAVISNVVSGMQAGLPNAAGLVSRIAGNTGLILGNIIDADAEYGIFYHIDNPLLRMGNNNVISSSIGLVGTQFMGQGREIYASATVDPGNCVDGAALAPINVTVTGANLNDAVEFGAPYDLQGLTVTAYVSLVNVVSIKIWNKTGGAVDLGSGTWKFRVTKM